MLRLIAKVVALLSLLGLTLPSVIFLAARMDLDRVKWIMIVATIVWFVSGSYWLWPRQESASG